MFLGDHGLVRGVLFSVVRVLAMKTYKKGKTIRDADLQAGLRK
jgi:hypothetical protein